MEPTLTWMLIRLLVAAQTTGIARPDTVWPTSVMGWVALALALFSVVGYGLTAWRASNKPVIDKMDAMKREVDREIKRIEGKVDDYAQSQHDQFHQALNHFRESTSHEISGFGRRVTEIEREHIQLESAVAELAKAQIESRADRQHINQQLVEMRRVFEADRTDRLAMERRLTQVIITGTRPRGDEED